MTPTQKLLIKKIYEKGRLLNADEAFDFYIEHVMRDEVTCRINYYRTDKNGRYLRDDYPLWQLEAKAKGWYKLNIGSLAINGHIPINANQIHIFWEANHAA